MTAKNDVLKKINHIEAIYKCFQQIFAALHCENIGTLTLFQLTNLWYIYFLKVFSDPRPFLKIHFHLPGNLTVLTEFLFHLLKLVSHVVHK